MPRFSQSPGAIRETQRPLQQGIFAYCKAPPDSQEWFNYQESRVEAIKQLKMKNMLLGTQLSPETKKERPKLSPKKVHPVVLSSPISQLDTDSKKANLPAALKKTGCLRPSEKQGDSSNVTWKEPVADLRFLPLDRRQFLDVTYIQERGPRDLPLSQTRDSNSRDDIKIRRSSDTEENQPTINPSDEIVLKNKKPYKRNNGKNILPSNLIKFSEKSNLQVKKSLNRAPKNIIARLDSRSNKITQFPKPTPERIPMSAKHTPNLERKSVSKQSVLQSEQSSSAPQVSKKTEAVAATSKLAATDVSEHSINLDATKSQSVSNANGSDPDKSLFEQGQEKKSSVGQFAEEKPNSKGPFNEDASQTPYFTRHVNDHNGNIVYRIVPTQKPLRNKTLESIPVGVDFPTPSDLDSFGKITENQSRDADINNNRWDAIVRKTSGNAESADAAINQNTYKTDKKGSTPNKVDILLKNCEPPKLPQFGSCNATPGTPEWRKYWDGFNSKLREYYSGVEKFSKRMDDLLVDEDGQEYKQQLQKRHDEEVLLKFGAGVTVLRPPIFREPLNDSIQLSSYVIRGLGGPIAEACVTSLDHNSFRLEIDYLNHEIGSEKINVDKKLNLMTVIIPSGDNSSPYAKLVQISVHNTKRVENLQIDKPLHNRGLGLTWLENIILQMDNVGKVTLGFGKFPGKYQWLMVNNGFTKRMIQNLTFKRRGWQLT